MADPESPFAEPMAFFGVISRSATLGETASQMQQRVSAEAERLGVRTSFDTRTALGSIYSQTVKLRETSRALSAAPGANAIVSDYVAPLPYARGGLGPGAPRLFDVRVDYTAVRGGQAEADYVTLRYTGGLPATVGELRAEAEDVTASLVEGYGASLTAVGAIQIGEL